METKEKLLGVIKEGIQDEVGKDISDLQEKADEQKEVNAKYLEENKELKDRLDAMQDKMVTIQTNSAGTQKYIFKGYDVRNPARNFKIDIDKDLRDKEAKNILETLEKALTTSATYATDVEYGTALLGLGELTSAVLGKMNVVQISSPILKLPNKTTRGTVDTQAFGTTNAGLAADLGQTTWTVDKRIGSYETLYNDILEDQIFDVVGQFIEPMLAEAIGQDVDDKVFNDTGAVFTTTIGADCDTDLSISIAASGVSFANLNEMYNTIEWARGITSAQWFGPQGAMKDVMGLVDGSNRLIFQQVPINGLPSYMLMGSQFNVTPAISNSPASTKIRLAFGDVSKYVLVLRGGMVFQANPYIGMKEGYTQFIGYMRADGNLTADTAWTTMKML